MLFLVVMPSHKYKNVPSKPEHEIEDIVEAIKAIVLEKKKQRTTAKAFQVNRSLLKRYMLKIEEAKFDVSTATDQQLYDFVFELTEKTGGKTVCIFSLIYFFIFFGMLCSLFLCFYRCSPRLKKKSS